MIGPSEGTPAYRIYRWSIRICLTVLVASVCYLAVRWRTDRIPQGADNMAPRFRPGQRIIYDPWATEVSDYMVGDVVIYEEVFPATEMRIRRIGVVKGLPGDAVIVRLDPITIDTSSAEAVPLKVERKGKVTVQKGHLFVGNHDPYAWEPKEREIPREWIVGRCVY